MWASRRGAYISTRSAFLSPGTDCCGFRPLCFVWATASTSRVREVAGSTIARRAFGASRRPSLKQILRHPFGHGEALINAVRHGKVGIRKSSCTSFNSRAITCGVDCGRGAGFQIRTRCRLVRTRKLAARRRGIMLIGLICRHSNIPTAEHLVLMEKHRTSQAATERTHAHPIRNNASRISAFGQHGKSVSLLCRRPQVPEGVSWPQEGTLPESARCDWCDGRFHFPRRSTILGCGNGRCRFPNHVPSPPQGPSPPSLRPLTVTLPTGRARIRWSNPAVGM